MDFRVYRRLKDVLEAALLARQEHMFGGGATDYPGYREDVGYIEGLNFALMELEEATKEEAA